MISLCCVHVKTCSSSFLYILESSRRFAIRTSVDKTSGQFIGSNSFLTCRCQIPDPRFLLGWGMTAAITVVLRCLVSSHPKK